MNNMESRCYRHIAIGRSSLLAVLRGDAVIEGLPDGATIVGWKDDWPTDALLVRVEHPSFAPVEPGHMIPVDTDYTFRTVERVVINGAADGSANAGLAERLKSIIDRGQIAAVVSYWEAK